MKEKEVFNHNILKINENETLFANYREITTTIRILRDEQKQFSMIHEKLQISKEHVDEYIKKHHDDSLQRHSRMIKTLQFLRQYCQFPQMRQKIEAYIKKCHNCKKNKHETHVQYERIQYQKSSIASWNEIFMNFIIKLSKLKNSTINVTYNAILVIVNHFIKYAHFISIKEKNTTKQLKFIVLN